MYKELEEEIKMTKKENGPITFDCGQRIQAKAPKQKSYVCTCFDTSLTKSYNIVPTTKCACVPSMLLPSYK